MKCFIAATFKPVLLSFFFIIISFTACKKHQPEIVPPHVVTIPIADIIFFSPIPNSVYNNGDSVSVRATATSTEMIHGYRLQIRKLNDTAVLYDEEVHDHNNTIQINKKWKNTMTAPADMIAAVTITLDHHGNLLMRKVGFRTQ